MTLLKKIRRNFGSCIGHLVFKKMKIRLIKIQGSRTILRQNYIATNLMLSQYKDTIVFNSSLTWMKRYVNKIRRGRYTAMKYTLKMAEKHTFKSSCGFFLYFW